MVNDLVNSGATDDQIREALRATGYSDADINSILGAPQTQTTQPTQTASEPKKASVWDKLKFLAPLAKFGIQTSKAQDSKRGGTSSGAGTATKPVNYEWWNDEY